MHYAFPFLPLEVQTSIQEIIALGIIPESAIDLLIARTAKALEEKTTSAQMDVVRIEHSIEQRVDAIGQKLASDLRTQHGATNEMLMALRTAQQTAHPQIDAALAGIKRLEKAYEDIEIWVARLERAFLAGRDFAAAERTRLEEKIDGAIATIDGALEKIDGAIDQLDTRVTVIEQALEIVPKAGA